MKEISRALLTGPGAAIVQLVVLAIVGWVFSAIASAAGKGQIANMIQIATVFVALTITITTVFTSLGRALSVVGL